MPPRNERIATMVRSELAKNPNIDNAALLEKARAIDPKVRRLSPRQFHATYRLPALRATGAKSPRPRPAESTKAASRTAATKTAARPAAPTPPAAPAMPSAPATPSAPAAPAGSPSAALAPAVTASAAPTSSSRALARPHAAEREAVRAMLQTVAREALGTEDRASFVRLLDSLDERASVVLGLFGRS
jgi:hypothetical protein